jgi:metal-dependent amidase/aminoacylase/carboxypeptidase family protein
VDAALCAHPGGPAHELTGKTLACAPVDIEFWGRTAHAASAPEQGVNALDALILVYNAINALRQHVTPDVRIHGIITHGGDAPNTVPAYAKAKFYLRAATAPGLESLYQRVQRIVEGAALATGATGGMTPYQNRVENTVPTPAFDAVYQREMALLGQRVDPPSGKGFGSTDAGNVSQVTPIIQPILSITDAPVAGHSEAMKAAACSKKGLDAILLGARALACTALDLLEDARLLADIQAEHRRLVAAQAGEGEGASDVR